MISGLLTFLLVSLCSFNSVFALDIPSTNVNQSQGGNSFTFVHLTDLHIGEGIADYGTTGYDDVMPVGDVGYAAQRLREAVNWINANAAQRNIAFVMVTGDLTDSAEKSEFLKCKEILEELTIPYVPMLGNHDIWPYTDSIDSGGALGTQYFMEIFGPVLDELSITFAGWDNGTRLTQTWNPEENTYNYFQNFAFDYNGYHFICADFNARWFSGTKGVPSEANLYDFTGGSWPWFKGHYNSYPKGNDNMLIFAHHPLSKLDITSSFSAGEYSTAANFFK